jgi:hypothetical protein
MGFTLLPAAAWLTGTLEMVTEIAGSVTDWATTLVFDVRTWVGVGLAGLAVVLWFVSGIIRDRQLARAQAAGGARASGGRDALPEASSTRTGPTSRPAVDDEMADIEALLRKRGIE